VYIIQLTAMPRRPRRSPEDAKAAALRAAGALHPQPERVQDPAFHEQAFFDRRDRVQVKYEMLRRHRVDRRPVTEVATAFGVSRQAFYQADRALAAGGLPGLLPRKRGPQRGHKCTDAVLEFVVHRRAQGGERGAAEVEAVGRRFGVTIHPRSLDRALARREKKRRRPAPPR
jgi:transposase